MDSSACLRIGSFFNFHPCGLLQEQGRAKQALEVVQGPLCAAVALPEERRLLTATLMVRCLSILTIATWIVLDP